MLLSASKLLCYLPVLQLLSFELPFVIDKDACCDVASAILLLQYNNGLHSVSYHSSKYGPVERNYGRGEKELFAIHQ